jgi:hypothetical protein
MGTWLPEHAVAVGDEIGRINLIPEDAEVTPP